MKNIVTYENIELLYNIFTYALIIVGIFISCFSMWYEYFTIGKNNETKKRIAKGSGIAITLILILAVLMIFFQGTYNVGNEVFDGDYLYLGRISKGKAEGYGKKYFNDGCILYEGYFKDNVYEGKGKYYSIVNIKNGEFLRGRETHFHYSKGEKNNIVHVLRYEGEFKDGLYKGNGKKYLPSPDYNENGILEYEGEFVDNHYCGKGKCYESFDKATGLKYSYGSCSKKDESKEIITYLRYEGEFDNGEYNGNGKLYYTGLDYDPKKPILEYKGKFKNNMKNGKGIEFDKYGNVVYKGLFIDDKRAK